MSAIEKTFSDGEVIIREGDAGNTFFQLLEGKAKVVRNYEEDDQVEIATLEEGQYFGEMAVIEDYPRNSTIIADGDVKVLEIAKEELNDYMAQNPDKILAIMKVLAIRIKKTDEAYLEAKKVRDDIRKADSDSRYDGFWARQQRLSIWMSPKASQLERPSAEELRQAGENVAREKSGNLETYNYGTVIFKQGEVGKYIYILHEGSVGVYNHYGEKDEFKLSTVEPVNCFGEIGTLLEEGHNATAVVETSGTQLEVIRADEIGGLFQSSPAKIDLLMKNLSYRLRSITYEYFKACQEIMEAEKNTRRR